MSASKISRKSLIRSTFDRVGDLVVNTIRFRRVLGSRRARRIYFHHRKENQRAAVLQKKRDDWKARRRKRKEKKPIRSHSLRGFVRLQRMHLNHFHRRSSPRKLLAIYLGPAAALSLVLTAVFVFSQTPTRALSVQTVASSAKQDLGKLLGETVRLLADNRLDEAQKNLDVLNAMAPGNFTVLAHNGAMHMLRKNYPAARAAYARALEAKPDSYITRYNLAEIEFLTKNYPEAERLFRQMHELKSDDEIILFRLALCAILQNDDASYQAYLGKLSHAGRSPVRQYATAARLIQDKKIREADRIIQQARIIFGDQIVAYDTTFREMGLIK